MNKNSMRFMREQNSARNADAFDSADVAVETMANTVCPLGRPDDLSFGEPEDLEDIRAKFG